MKGGGGDDHLSGGRDADTLNGGGGDDVLAGGGGHDRLIGRVGHDKLIGGVVQIRCAGIQAKIALKAALGGIFWLGAPVSTGSYSMTGLAVTGSPILMLR